MPAQIGIETLEHRVGRLLGSGLGTRWVVGVSGGSDSVGLLRGLHAISGKLGLTLSVAHLDHGARGEGARRDAEFVATLAGSLDLPFDLGHWQPSRAGHFEADARKARHDWLRSMAQSRGASTVALGHTRDDQAETILHRLIRGTGPRGLAAIPIRRKLGDGITLVRPLLDCSREDIRNYLLSLNQPYQNDPTNHDLTRTRARIRHDLLPKLAEEYNPRVVEALARLGDLSREANRALERRVATIARSEAVWSNPGSIALNRESLQTLQGFLRLEVLRFVWRESGWPEVDMTAKRWRNLARFVRKTEGRMSVGAGVDAEIRGHCLVLNRPEANRVIVPCQPQPLPIPGSVAWGDGRIVALERVDDPEIDVVEIIDLDAVTLPLSVRAPEPGDRFEPLGMNGQGMALNDFFRGRRVSREMRSQTPLVCDGLGILWVVGHRIADRARVKDGTTRRVGLRWETSRPIARLDSAK